MRLCEFAVAIRVSVILAGYIHVPTGVSVCRLALCKDEVMGERLRIWGKSPFSLLSLCYK